MSRRRRIFAGMWLRLRRSVAARGARLGLVFLLVVALGAPAAAAAPGLAVGVTEDGFRRQPLTAVTIARDLGLTTFRVSLGWTPSQTELSTSDAEEFDTLVPAAFGLRIVVTVYGTANSTPLDSDGRAAYCAYVRNLFGRYPTINDVVIWNEPNLGYFWKPQFDSGGASLAPAAYARLLAHCWDVLHEFRPSANVIMTTSPSGTDNPRAVSNVSHAPGSFIRKLGAAYRASGRTQRIFDTVGHNPYGMNSAELPWRRHLVPSHIAQGDSDRLVQALADGFRGTAQPTPAQCAGASSCPSIWYLEAGYQTVPDAAHRALYVGRENDAHPIPDLAEFGAKEQNQSSQLAAGIKLAYCQPYVGAFFNFLLWDEPDLARWQSGVLWVDGSRKNSFDALSRVVDEVGGGRVDCAKLGAAHRMPSQPAPDAIVERIEWSPLTVFSVFNEIWRFGISARADATYRAILYRVGQGRRARALKTSGALRRGRPRVVRFRERRLRPGKYRIDVVVMRKRPPRISVRRSSPTFLVT
jgi:hypothetical protein